MTVPNIHSIASIGVVEQHPVFTIGHSNAAIEKLVSLLKNNGVQVLVDVRSVPYSRHVPQANREKVEEAVKNEGIKYLFMGDRLGGRPENVEVRDDLGNYDYSELAAAEGFKEGIGRLIRGACEHRICLLCSEEDPVKCHRGLLISRELAKLGVEVRHIRHDGKVDSQAKLEERVPLVQKGLFSEKQQ